MPELAQNQPAALEVPGPDGVTVTVPTDVEDPDPYRALPASNAFVEYFRTEGYVVARNVIPAELCAQARHAFVAEVHPYAGPIYRQASARPELNVFTPAGHVLNSLLNVQSLSSTKFPRFKQLGLQIILDPGLLSLVQRLLGEPGTAVQTMYFEGNPATWAHQDTYYLDSTELGRMVAAWIAVEDIHAGAGRFFVYPRSHSAELVRNTGTFNIATHHDRYKRHVQEMIAREKYQCRAPALRAGDVLFWASRTIHGSLCTTQPERSRCSFTAHFIPSSTDLLQWQSRKRTLALQTIHGARVHCPKDQDLWKNRLILGVESTFPNTFQFCKKLVTKALLR